MNQTFAKFINGSFFYEYPCTVSTECHPIETTLSTGFWKLECWGASGDMPTTMLAIFTQQQDLVDTLLESFVSQKRPKY